ncbi:MAG: response regulator transcription factor [Rhodospirillaceae bacterium]|jgi:two-component system phosphate regulon response regulator OmpR|nr:response regulator transcription factor [Rhodospirillaceae bacterium]
MTISKFHNLRSADVHKKQSIISKKIHILVVDDDARLRQLLSKYLIENNYLVSVASDANEARKQLSAMIFDLIILDVMMPGETGLALTKSLRFYNSVPILLLTAMSEPIDRIIGLESGADDYLTKPFEPRELLLRINNITLRNVDRISTNLRKFRFDRFVFDQSRDELLYDKKIIHLTSTEITLLNIFITNLGKIMRREYLIMQIGNNYNSRTVDVQINRLRKKIENNPHSPRYLQTIRGQGYVLWID